MRPVTVLCILVLAAALPAHAQDQSLQHMQRCTELLERLNAHEGVNRGETPPLLWEDMVFTGRIYLSLCRDQMDYGPGGLAGRARTEATILNDIGVSLHNLGKYDDAIPVLQRCVSVNPDAAPCWTNMGLSFVELNKLEEARDSFRRAVAIGGYDVPNAAAVEVAKKQLAALGTVPPSSGAASGQGVAPSPVGTFVAEKQSVLAKVADPRKAWLLRCFRESRRCEHIEASVLDVGLVDIWPFEYAILGWDANGIVAQNDSATCVTARLVVNFAHKSVTLFTSPKKLKIATSVCRAASSETIELMRNGDAK